MIWNGCIKSSFHVQIRADICPIKTTNFNLILVKPQRKNRILVRMVLNFGENKYTKSRLIIYKKYTNLRNKERSAIEKSTGYFFIHFNFYIGYMLHLVLISPSNHLLNPKITYHNRKKKNKYVVLLQSNIKTNLGETSIYKR